MSRDLERLADLLGVAPGYTDAFGQPVETSLETRAGMIAALGFPVGTDAEIAASLAEVTRVREGLVPSLLPVEARRATRVPLRASSAGTLAWRLVDERGHVREGRVAVATSREAGF